MRKITCFLLILVLFVSSFSTINVEARSKNGSLAFQMKEMSRLAYNYESKETRLGWKHYKSVKHKNSLQYKIYRKKNGKKNDYTIAISGSKQLKDYWSDFEEITLSEYTGQSKQLIKDINKFYKKDEKDINKFYITGHSLGGFLASLAVSDVVLHERIKNIPKSKVKGYTYNAPGIKKHRIGIIKASIFVGGARIGLIEDPINVKKIKEKKKFKNYIINYNIKGDVVNEFGTQLGAIKPINVKNRNKYQKHLINSFDNL